MSLAALGAGGYPLTGQQEVEEQCLMTNMALGRGRVGLLCWLEIREEQAAPVRW